jgi:hypothetical protein
MKKTGILIVGAILIACGLVAAGTIICLSNVVEHENTVEVAVELSILTTTATPGGDLPDYAAGPLLMGQTYDMMIRYTTSKALSTSSIIVEFTKTGIAVTDLSMYWTDGTTWTQMTWIDSGDVLKGTLGYVGSQPSGETVTYFAKLTYDVPGVYGFKVWVEGAVQ